MTPTRFRAIREAAHLTTRGLARWTDRAESTLRQMEAEQRAIPAELAAWMEKFGRWIDAHPPPEKRR
jgi:DNA-binding transcriptional regulator YiaG